MQQSAHGEPHADLLFSPYVGGSVAGAAGGSVNSVVASLWDGQPSPALGPCFAPGHCEAALTQADSLGVSMAARLCSFPPTRDMVH
eukprot:10110826-Prorocentrum_lima.AAC.1